jgi:hypothetical protein
MEKCNLGWSDAHLAALRQVILRLGEVVSVHGDYDVRLRWRRWQLSTYPAERTYWGQPPWRITESEAQCGQCTECSALTPATIRRTAANLPYIEPEQAHITEDAIMRRVLHEVANGHEGSQALAREAFAMATGQRTRWYS